MRDSAKVYIAGHRGLVGGAITRHLQEMGYQNLILRSHNELDLQNHLEVKSFFAEHKPDYVFLAAAKVGGIYANDTYPAEFLYENLNIQNNVIDSAYRYGVKKLVFLGSSCIYPKLAKQPIKESSLLTGPLESTNEWYAIAKIAGIKLCQAYRKQYGFNAISLMPTNLYGPGDNFDLQKSHVLPALIRKCHEATLHGANEVIIWGTGEPRREFLYVDDMADAAIYFMKHYDGEEIINVGVGEDLSIKSLAELVAEIVGYRGAIINDTSKPDGTPRKLLDVERLHQLGWRAQTGLREGIAKTYEWFLKTGQAKRL